MTQFSPTDLREMRRDNGWTQSRLAGLAGLDQATISHLEAGRNHPTVHTLRALEHALDLDHYWTS